MSRTYRKFPIAVVHWKRAFYINKRYQDYEKDLEGYEFPMGANWFEDYSFKSNDKKPWFKPNSVYKKLERRKDKAEIKDALRKGKEIPIHKKRDIYDYC